MPPTTTLPDVTIDTDAGALASELRVVLGQLIRRLRAEHAGFSISQGAVLGRLDRQGTTSISELALIERVRPQSMAQTVGELEAEGLISRRPDPADGRRALLELTESGRRRLAADRANREGWLTGAIDQGLSEREQRVLREAVELLRRLAESQGSAAG